MIYIDEGDDCIDPECGGTYQIVQRTAGFGEGCSCHINPPCMYCLDTVFECDRCRERPEEE